MSKTTRSSTYAYITSLTLLITAMILTECRTYIPVSEQHFLWYKIALIATAVFFIGYFRRGSNIQYGRIANIEDLEDAVYTLRQIVKMDGINESNDVYILVRSIKGEPTRYAVSDLHRYRLGLAEGDSFRKSNEKVTLA